MRLAPALALATASLRAHKLRSALTMLGVVIGVLSTVIMVSLGQGATRMIDSQVRALGTNILILSTGFGRRGGVTTADAGQPLTDRDAAAIAREVPGVEVAAPIRQGGARLVADGINWQTQLQGSTAALFVARDYAVGEGRLFTPVEERGAAKVAIIGRTVARNLFPGQSAVGRAMRANRVPLRVIGVLASKGQNTMGFDQDDTVIVPLKTAQSRLLGGGDRAPGEVNQIVVKAVSAQALPQVEQGVDALMRQRQRLAADEPASYNLRNISQLVALSTSTLRIMTTLLAGIASVALLVGGIGIMNIMLVSVTERTREIGLRMAVGARPADIRLQFLAEAGLLSALGGALAVALALPIGWAIASATDWPVGVQPPVVVVALVFSAAVGVGFGWYPARRASRLNPIEALRHD